MTITSHSDFNFTLGKGVKYFDQCVCFVYLSVRSHVSRTTCPNFTNFSTCYMWPWLGLHLAALRYVMYFRFCG